MSTQSTNFVPVPVQIDHNGYNEYDAWLFLENQYSVDSDELCALLLAGDTQNAQKQFLNYGLDMAVEPNEEMITVSDMHDRSWYVTLQILSEATLYKRNSSGEHVRAPVEVNKDGSNDFNGWYSLARRYKLPVSDIALAIIHADYEEAAKLSTTENTYGEQPKRDVNQIVLNARRKVNTDDAGDDNNDSDEFVIHCTDRNDGRFVSIQCRMEALLYRSQTSSGQGIRQVKFV